MEVYIGKVLDIRGLKGELIIYFFTKKLRCDKNDNLFFENLSKNFTKSGPYKVEYLKEYKIKTKLELFILKLFEVDKREKSELLNKCYIIKQYDVLPENVFLKGDLLQCDVVVENSNLYLGKVSSILDVSPEYRLLIVKKANSADEIFIPFIKEIISKVDTKNKIITTKQIDGVTVGI